jgi:hypothetical protein
LRYYKLAAVEKNYLRALHISKGVLQQQAMKVRLTHEYQRRKQ